MLLGMGSHLPVLVAIAARVPVRHVVEFGSGFYSTAAFLRRGLFPVLERLVSFESSEEFDRRVRAQVGTDPRHDLRLVPVDMRDRVVEAESADLVLVDNDPWEERVAVLDRIVDVAVLGIVVIHDVESHLYADALRRFRGVEFFSPLAGCPSTAVASTLSDALLLSWQDVQQAQNRLEKETFQCTT